MNSKSLMRKAVSACIMITMLATYSMVALAASDRASGDLVVTGTTDNGVTPYVLVNGMAARTGRTIFSSSTITTPNNVTATIDMGKAGQIELSAGSSISLSFDATSASVDLTSGTLNVLKSEQKIHVNTAGNSLDLSAGDSANAGGPADDKDYRDSNGKCVDANKNGKEECDSGPAAWWLWALVFAGATAGVVVGVSQGNNNFALGGGGAIISPTR
jgi:hypothetical protein